MHKNLKNWIPVSVAIILVGMFLLPKLYWALFPEPPKPGLFGDVEPDLAAYIGAPGRMPFFDGTKMNLGGSGFQAWGTWARYGGDPVDKKSFYKVSVVLQHKSYGTVYTKEFYTRYVPKEGVPDDFWDKDIAEFTSYDEKSRTAIFLVGEEKFVCTLPEKIFLPEDSEIVKAEE